MINCTTRDFLALLGAALALGPAAAFAKSGRKKGSLIPPSPIPAEGSTVLLTPDMMKGVLSNERDVRDIYKDTKAFFRKPLSDNGAKLNAVVKFLATDPFGGRKVRFDISDSDASEGAQADYKAFRAYMFECGMRDRMRSILDLTRFTLFDVAAQLEQTVLFYKDQGNDTYHLTDAYDEAMHTLIQKTPEFLRRTNGVKNLEAVRAKGAKPRFYKVNELVNAILEGRECAKYLSVTGGKCVASAQVYNRLQAVEAVNVRIPDKTLDLWAEQLANLLERNIPKAEAALGKVPASVGASEAICDICAADAKTLAELKTFAQGMLKTIKMLKSTDNTAGALRVGHEIFPKCRALGGYAPARGNPKGPPLCAWADAIAHNYFELLRQENRKARARLGL